MSDLMKFYGELKFDDEIFDQIEAEPFSKSFIVKNSSELNFEQSSVCFEKDQMRNEMVDGEDQEFGLHLETTEENKSKFKRREKEVPKKKTYHKRTEEWSLTEKSFPISKKDHPLNIGIDKCLDIFLEKDSTVQSLRRSGHEASSKALKPEEIFARIQNLPRNPRKLKYDQNYEEYLLKDSLLEAFDSIIQLEAQKHLWIATGRRITEDCIEARLDKVLRPVIRKFSGKPVQALKEACFKKKRRKKRISKLTNREKKWNYFKSCTWGLNLPKPTNGVDESKNSDDLFDRYLSQKHFGSYLCLQLNNLLVSLGGAIYMHTKIKNFLNRNKVGL